MLPCTDFVTALPEIQTDPSSEVLILVLSQPHCPAASVAPRARERSAIRREEEAIGGCEELVTARSAILACCVSAEVMIETFLRDPLHRRGIAWILPAVAAATSQALVVARVAAKVCNGDRVICPIHVIMPCGVAFAA